LLATVDVAIAPGPVETFGLAALEALASGTPVVVSAQSALPEVIGAAGLAVPGEGPAYATAVREIMSRPVDERRSAARAQAETFPWSASVAGFLEAHGFDNEPDGVAAGGDASGAEDLDRDAPGPQRGRPLDDLPVARRGAGHARDQRADQKAGGAGLRLERG
jgi:hypothetical protein